MSTTIIQPPAKPGPLLATVRRWLGLDALAQVQAVKDAEARALRERVDALDQIVGTAVGQLNRVTAGLGNLDDRLKHYERTVPGITGAKRAYDQMVQREVRRRKALIEAHPDLAEAGRQFVMRTGELPARAAAPESDSPNETGAPQHDGAAAPATPADG